MQNLNNTKGVELNRIRIRGTAMPNTPNRKAHAKRGVSLSISVCLENWQFSVFENKQLTLLSLKLYFIYKFNILFHI